MLEPLFNFFCKVVSGSKMLGWLFLLFPCAHSAAAWRVDKARAADPRSDSTRFLYEEKSARLEVYQTRAGSAGYFSVTSLPIPSLAEDPSKSWILLAIDGEEEKILVHRVAGGQKLVLPEKTLEKILHAIKKRLRVTLKTGRYALVVEGT